MAKATTKAMPNKAAAAKKSTAPAEATSKAAAAPKAKAAKPTAVAAAPKAKKAPPSKIKAVEVSIGKIAKETSDAISTLASDILADRIVPTIEQINSIAASALGQDQTKDRSRSVNRPRNEGAQTVGDAGQRAAGYV